MPAAKTPLDELYIVGQWNSYEWLIEAICAGIGGKGKHMSAALVEELKSIHRRFALEDEPVGVMLTALIKFVESELTAKPPDLSDHSDQQLRFLKRRVRRAKKSNRKYYRNIPIVIWAQIIANREKELGIGTRGGRPPEAL